MLLCLAYPPYLVDEKMRQRNVWHNYLMEGGVRGRKWISDPSSQPLVYSSVRLNFWNSGHIYLSLPSTFPLHTLPNTANLYPTLVFVRFICSFEFHSDCLSLSSTDSITTSCVIYRPETLFWSLLWQFLSCLSSYIYLLQWPASSMFAKPKNKSHLFHLVFNHFPLLHLPASSSKGYVLQLWSMNFLFYFSSSVLRLSILCIWKAITLPSYTISYPLTHLLWLPSYFDLRWSL